MKIKFILILVFITSCTSYDEMLNALETKQGIEKLKRDMDYIKVSFSDVNRRSLSFF